MTRTRAPGLAWHLLDLRDDRDSEQARIMSKLASSHTSPGGRSFSLSWRLGPERDVGSIRAWLLENDGVPVGFAIFSVRQLALRYSFGELPLGRVNLTRSWHIGEPYVGGELTHEARVKACSLLLLRTLDSLGRNECLFLEGLPVESPMFQAVFDPIRGSAPWLVLKLGDTFDHQFIRMPATYAEYLSQLGAKSRQSVLYSQRRLRRDMAGEVRCDCFQTEEDVARFVLDASSVSKKTYQWNLLGLGLRDTASLRTSLTHAARHGWFRSYVLYCRGVPVAFMLGYQHGDCYYYDDVGYDPAFAKWSVGTVLQLEALEHLYSLPGTPRHFDFSTGYGQHKGRFGNFSRTELNLVILPATMRNKLIAASYKASCSISRGTVKALERLGVKNQVKRLMRRLAVKLG